MEPRTRQDTFSISEDKKGIKNDKFNSEIENLKKKGPLTQADIISLYKKYPNDEQLVDTLIKERNKTRTLIRKKARKFADKIHSKYGNTKTTHEIIEKMLAYKTHYKWSDAEFDEFRKEVTARLTGTDSITVSFGYGKEEAYKSRINRALGSPLAYEAYVGEGLSIKESEHVILNDILKLQVENEQLHKAVVIQTMQYEDLGLLAMTGTYDRQKHVASDHIHPLLAAMFLPKINIFETYMLYADFGRLIKTRHEKKPILEESDALLFQSIVSDINDVVCETDSAIGDLRNRYKVQICLWDTILKLRNGKYYDDKSHKEFMSVLNLCRNNLYDSPDLAFKHDEVSMIRKLMSVFSLRPIVQKTTPINLMASIFNGPIYGGQYGDLYSGQPVPTLTYTPVIQVTIPVAQKSSSTTGTADTNTPYDLRIAATAQRIWLNEKGMIVPKDTSVLCTNEILIFAINRRLSSYTLKTFTQPIPFARTPLTLSSFDYINKYPVGVHLRLTVEADAIAAHELRSVVAVTETQVTQQGRVTSLITGTVALLAQQRNPTNQMFNNKFWIYDPLGASIPVKMTPGATTPSNSGDCDYFMNKPISYIPETVFSAGQTGHDGFIERASTCGTVFIYAKPGQYTGFY